MDGSNKLPFQYIIEEGRHSVNERGVHIVKKKRKRIGTQATYVYRSSRYRIHIHLVFDSAFAKTQNVKTVIVRYNQILRLTYLKHITPIRKVRSTLDQDKLIHHVHRRTRVNPIDII